MSAEGLSRFAIENGYITLVISLTQDHLSNMALPAMLSEIHCATTWFSFIYETGFYGS